MNEFIGDIVDNWLCFSYISF